MRGLRESGRYLNGKGEGKLAVEGRIEIVVCLFVGARFYCCFLCFVEFNGRILLESDAEIW